MKKKSFFSLLAAVVGGLLFSLGLCMCLLPEWNAFTAGVVFTAVGGVVLLALLVIHRKALWRPQKPVDKRAVASATLGVLGALAFGLGMSMVMVWSLLVPGILVGIVGIALLLCILPVQKGLT